MKAGDLVWWCGDGAWDGEEDELLLVVDVVTDLPWGEEVHVLRDGSRAWLDVSMVNLVVAQEADG